MYLCMTILQLFVSLSLEEVNFFPSVTPDHFYT